MKLLQNSGGGMNLTRKKHAIFFDVDKNLCGSIVHNVKEVGEVEV